MISMGTWAEIKRLHKTGLKVARIARQLGVARGTVYSAINDEAVPAYGPRQRGSMLDPFKDYIRQRVIKHDLSAVRIFAEIREKGYRGGKTVLKEFIGPLRREQRRDLVIRFETEPGQQAQVDWAEGFGRIWHQGRWRRLNLFVMTLGYSRFLTGEFTVSERLPVLLDCHIHAFRSFGGCPKEALYDNMRTVVDPTTRVINPRFLDFARYYGFAPRLCEPMRAQTKGKVERVIGYVRDNFFKGRSFADLGHLNRQFCRLVQGDRQHPHARHDVGSAGGAFGQGAQRAAAH